MKPKQIVSEIKGKGFTSECPHCKAVNQLDEIEIFDDKRFATDQSKEVYEEMLSSLEKRKEKLLKMKDDKHKWLTKNTAATNVGFILERLIPALGTFGFKHTDARSMFDPLDYVIFNGLSDKGYVDNITFIDVKSGNARLTKKQEEIRDVIKAKNVKFRLY